MTTKNILAVGGFSIAKVGFAIAAFALLIAPAVTSAATYAFVNAQGDVNSVEASTPTIAIDTAYNRAVHSGVMLLITESSKDILETSI